MAKVVELDDVVKVVELDDVVKMVKPEVVDHNMTSARRDSAVVVESLRASTSTSCLLSYPIFAG